ncbi:MAG: hypothetical protein KF770_14350 [Anaerolineae bacterium]|nr:hypothetical protein [Anaerolineae bacterium]
MNQETVLTAPPVAAHGDQPEPNQSSYQQYYRRVIDQQLSANDFGALKLVVGPTGMGKTSAIPTVIAHLRAQPVEKRCIYTSHRHLLIGEMVDALQEQGIPFVYLKNNEEMVAAFLNWPDRGDFLARLETCDFFKLAGSSRTAVEKQMESLRQEQTSLRQLQNSGFPAAYEQQRLGFRERCDWLLNIFKAGLAHKDLPPDTHKRLLSDAGIWQLFPYVEFLHNPAQPVLLVTVQKLLYGFFNGRANERLLSLEDHIIFLDEFDMQEKEMLSFLCRSPEIQNSFEFVRLFYEEMSRQRQLGHLDPIPGEPERRTKAKQQVGQIIDKLQADCQKEGISFPQIRHFVLREGEFPSNHLAVFQSGVQIMSNPFYLCERGQVWEVVRQSGPDTKRARPLMTIITQTANAILDFFSELWADELTPEWHSWIDQCYDQKNDNTPGRYQEIISNYGFYRRPSRLATERHDPAIADSIYYQGYSFFRLVRGAFFTTPDEIRLEQKKLTVTPEYLLWRLSNANLVFALSATGDIKRYIQSFDMNWLERYGRDLPIDEQDKALVSSLKQQKEAKRNYQVVLSVANELPRSHALSYALDQLVQEQFFSREEEEATGEAAILYRQHALNLFLETARWIAHESNNQAHLLFLNSFTFMEKLFRPDNGLPKSFFASLRPYLAVDRLGDGRSREYKVTMDGRPCQVIFLDAAKGREMEDQTFRQAEPDMPLVIVTTYPTAANGVNLKWHRYGQEKATGPGYDLEGIHLLEAPHFYFSGTDGSDDVDKEKMFIWQVWKLYHNFQISESQFVTALRELNIADVNAQYKSTPDYLLNQIAVFHQALGRIDRQWQPMPPIEIRLAAGRSDVLGIFEEYLTAPGAIAENRLAREAYTSSLILALYQEIEKAYLRRSIVNQLQYESFAATEKRARQVTDRLLQMINGVRSGAYAPADAQKVMDLWWRIREAVLKQDYHFQSAIEVVHLPSGQTQRVVIDFRRDFVLETAILQDGDMLLIDWETHKIHRQPSQATKRYSLNRYYRHYAQNPTIAWYFRTHNYRLCYEPANQNLFFTPYIQQNILAGAVGEAALKAALQQFHIPLAHERDCLPTLFEISDMQLQGLPIYLDAKNYSQWTTLYRFAAGPEDPAYDEKLNAAAFLTAAQKKWGYLAAQTGNQDVKLVFINLAAGENHPNEGWDAQLNPVRPYRFRDSAITIIQGVIDLQDPQAWRPDFVDWVNDVKAIYHKAEGANDGNSE